MERYRSYSTFLKEFFGKKLYKICLDGGCTCPNRDGSLGTGGCIFCSAGGSGEFSEDASLPITDQLKRGRAQSARKYDGDCFIAYFQAFTGTYTDPDRLRSMLSQAMSPDWILAVAGGGKNPVPVMKECRKIILLEDHTPGSRRSTDDFLSWLGQRKEAGLAERCRRLQVPLFRELGEWMPGDDNLRYSPFGEWAAGEAASWR